MNEGDWSGGASPRVSAGITRLEEKRKTGCDRRLCRSMQLYNEKRWKGTKKTATSPDKHLPIHAVYLSPALLLPVFDRAKAEPTLRWPSLFFFLFFFSFRSVCLTPHLSVPASLLRCPTYLSLSGGCFCAFVLLSCVGDQWDGTVAALGAVRPSVCQRSIRDTNRRCQRCCPPAPLHFTAP